MSTYYDAQFERLKPVNEYGLKIQLSSDSGKTNHMNITEAQAEAILKILNQPAVREDGE